MALLHDAHAFRHPRGHEQAQGEGSHAVVNDAGLAIGQEQQLIAAQEFQEQQGADAFVSIGEGVIRDHEVEQMGRPQLGCRLKGLAIKGLLDRSKDAGQRLAVLLPEQRGGFTAMGKVAAQGVDGQLGLRQSQGLRHAIGFCECGS